ncbi:GNAT family N-acetyltransferase [Zunongwangia profunda]|uniref:GNAT family acetyltransferase n=2 Tax=Zunongwangia profunda TaxID=398743 RepID=D5BEU5_ZUNPS|nr:GNAT family N-acetyltransferase [Zunongwangia profunda]ADF50824.1 GNAT family acetyltransferase [Zunongwangia profunda SM-A87]MAS69815.1 N-acetyltransferase [Zunongwangia sp.]HAJ81176.1 N-acetyltransferase [Zunongwangia profunda]HCV80388.1 N-acetyltransferase [Zunongwangia profunda]|tara:strand:- start:2837 stop:3310 length:474 start_codon:yes stop_codon:yes gene_type:complete
MEYQIREAKREDMPKVLELIMELAKHENAEDQVEISVKDLETEGFNNGNFKCFVADVDGKLAGMALVYFRFSTWKGRTVHLEDLIVTESMRGTGLGGALYNQVVKYGYEHGVKRVEWVVSEGNKNAIEFYENTGADIKKNWYTVHMNENVIKKNIEK